MAQFLLLSDSDELLLVRREGKKARAVVLSVSILPTSLPHTCPFLRWWQEHFDLILASGIIVLCVLSHTCV